MPREAILEQEFELQRRLTQQQLSRIALGGAIGTGLFSLLTVLSSTWWIPDLRIAVRAGIPWLVVISLCYLAWRRWQRVP